MSEDTPPDETEEYPRPGFKGRKWKQLTPAQWEQVVVLFEMGKVTVADLVQMFGISDVGLRKGLKKRGAVKGCRAHEIGQSAVEAAKSDAQKNFERISTMKERMLGYTDLIAKLTMREITEAVKSSTPLSTKRHDLQSLQRAMAVIQAARSENYHLLGLNDEFTPTEELPDIGIAEYSADEIDKIQRGFDDQDEILDSQMSDIDDVDLALPFEDDEEADI